MGETVCGRRDGMGTTGQTVGWDTVGNWADSETGNSRDGNKTPYGGMVDGGNRNQVRDGSGIRGREQKTTRVPVPVPYRTVPVSITLSVPTFFRA